MEYLTNRRKRTINEVATCSSSTNTVDSATSGINSSAKLSSCSTDSQLDGQDCNSRSKRSKTQRKSKSPPNFIPNDLKESILRRIPQDELSTVPGLVGPNPFLTDLPNDVEAALTYLSQLFPRPYFNGRLPAIILSSQLNSILKLSSMSEVDNQLRYLIFTNKIIIFPTFSNLAITPFNSKTTGSSSSNYLIVFYDEFVNLRKHTIDPIFEQFVKHVLPYQNTEKPSVDAEKLSHEIIKDVSLLRLISKSKLTKLLKIEDENDIRRLVNSGYLGIQDHGHYCLSLPGAGEFIKIFEKGKRVVLGQIRKAKFGEILQKELEKRKLAKTAPLGIQYHITDLIGSGIISSVNTTSGSLIRYRT